MRFELATFVAIGTDFTGSCKSNYHTITTTMAPSLKKYNFVIEVIYSFGFLIVFDMSVPGELISIDAPQRTKIYKKF